MFAERSGFGYRSLMNRRAFLAAVAVAPLAPAVPLPAPLNWTSLDLAMYEGALFGAMRREMELAMLELARQVELVYWGQAPR